MKQDFVDYVLEDTNRLVVCDSGRFVYDEIEEQYFVEGATSGSLLYELGLRDGDFIMNVNSLDVSTTEEALETFGVLYFEENQTEFEVEVQSDPGSFVVDIEIVR